MHRLFATIAVAATAAFGTVAQAETVDIIGGETDVAVTADLAGLGLRGSTTGSATVALNGDGLPVFTFGITGGLVDDDGNALIEHDGSGVRLASATEPDTSASVGNFLIDTEAGNVSGTVNGGLTAVLFDFGDAESDLGVELLISSALGEALFQTFGADGLAGAQFGFANPQPVLAVAPAPIPLPASGLLLIAALGGIGLARRRPRS